MLARRPERLGAAGGSLQALDLLRSDEVPRYARRGCRDLPGRVPGSGGGATASPEARGTEGLAGLVRVAYHKAIKWKTRARRQAASAQVEDDVHGLVDATPTADQLLEQLQRELAVRAAVTALPKRCRQLVEQLFFTTPPPPTPRSPSVSGSLPARSGSSVGGA